MGFEVKISSDKMSAEIAVSALTDSGRSTQASDCLLALKQAGVSCGILNDDIARAAADAVASRHLRRIKAAEGKKPVKGEDGRLEILAKVPEISTDENARIDYKFIPKFVYVRAGDRLACAVLAAAGTDGRDVCGNLITAAKGADVKYSAGDGIREEKTEGAVWLMAERSGVFEVKGTHLSIAERLSITGDVDPSIGNIDCPVDVSIAGSVSGGFKVVSAGNIYISGTVENSAEIDCGGNLEIKGGLIGSECRARCRGNFSAGFVQEAQVNAGGDVAIFRSVYLAKVRSLSKISVLGKGQNRHSSCVGSVLCARNSVETAVVGSGNDASISVLAAGGDFIAAKELEAAEKELNSSNSFIIRLSRASGVDLSKPDAAAQIRKMPEEKRLKAVQVIKSLKERLAAKERLEQKCAEIRSRKFDDNRKAFVAVAGSVQAFTVVITNLHEKFPPQSTAAEFHIDEEMNCIILKPYMSAGTKKK